MRELARQSQFIKEELYDFGLRLDGVADELLNAQHPAAETRLRVRSAFPA
jgi:hypothetical protein